MRINGNFTPAQPTHPNATVVTLIIDFANGSVAQTERLPDGSLVTITMTKVPDALTPSVSQFRSTQISGVTLGQVLQKAMLAVHNQRYAIAGTVPAGAGVDDDLG